MLDARRMEVYTALFDGNRNWKHQTSALVLTENSFKDLVEQKKVFILGDGAKKFQELNPKISAQFSTENNYPNANDMVELAWQKYKAKDFESLAYFEPFYLKDFQTTPPKKKTNS
jgi:tRNA threonylcarbamoyladenosine biosynthesis protein TsaB